MVKFEFAPFMEKLGVNQQMLSQLMKISKTSVSQWVQAGAIPEKHLAAINAITEEQAAAVHTWMPYPLRDLRIRLGIKRNKLAGILETCKTNTVKWEKKGRIPRDRLRIVEELARKIENNPAEKGAA